MVSAVLVTKGDVDLRPVIDSLPFDDIIIWDNSKRQDLKVFGRYAAIAKAKHDIIFSQDDDCIVDAAAVVAQYETGRVVCNMPAVKRREYSVIAPGISLVGWGACFDKELAGVLDRFDKDELFLRECDRVFTALNDCKLIDVPFNHLPHAYTNRMGNEARHLSDLREIQQRIAGL